MHITSGGSGGTDCMYLLLNFKTQPIVNLQLQYGKVPDALLGHQPHMLPRS